MEPHIWEEASVAFPDFAGHVELDFRITNSALEEAGIDESRWQVIGFEWDRGEQFEQLYVIAVDKGKIPDGEDTIFERLTAEHGHVPATKILMHDVDPAAFLHSVTHSFGMTLRARGVGNAEIVVDELGDIPEQH